MAAPNWANETMWTGDNLPIMRGMNSESVDLIYLDPPFNSKANYAAPIGSQAAGAEFKDTWTLNDIDNAWVDLIDVKHPSVRFVIDAAMTDSDKSYLIYMAARLIEMHRILKSNGSIYLHCDPTMSHYLKLLMDAIWGRGNFRNEIVWCYTGPGSPKMRNFPRKHDIIFRYTAGSTWIWNGAYVPYAPGFVAKTTKTENNIWGIADLEDLKAREKRGKLVEDWWSDIPSAWYMQKTEKIGYPTQKPLALLDRIIEASSDPGDMVLDPFAGCATACVSAFRHERQWTGIDVSSKAYDLVRQRIAGEGPLLYSINQRTDVPQRTDLGRIPRYNAPANKTKLYGEQGGDCAGCKAAGREAHFEPRHLTIDHIIARSQGGTDHIDNLQLLCANCNSIKGNRGMEYLVARLARN